MKFRRTGINVAIYSYKSKNTFNCIDRLLQTASKENFIFIHLHDQHHLDRSGQFINLLKKYQGHANGAYVHIFWDLIDSPIEIKQSRTLGASTDYMMFIDDRIMLNDNWDLKMIDKINGERIVISGNYNPTFKNKNLFFVEKNKSYSDSFCLTKYISQNFIFGNREMLKTSKFGQNIFPTYLKHVGFEEALSLQYFKDNIEIYSAPQNLYAEEEYNVFKDFNVYMPFSKLHNYNEVIELFKTGTNKFGQIQYEIINNFNKFHNFNFSSLNKLPYPKDDVIYNMRSSRFDRIDGRRFIESIKTVN